MTIDDLKQLLANKTILDFETGDQDFEHGLRIVLQDTETGALGLLAIEPQQLALPDECVLAYSYQELDAGLGVPEHLYDIQTKIGPDFEKGEIPFLFN